ncbi:venom acid phosphatase Acph-1-like [Diachasmimorpha longicaudata]|uniref:venom acid phosphatase Acph-1-like n=1 Tax=Diachasmimorpha longicaudata TaxID=58733 RepID=UPI0030B86BD8
MKIHYGWTILCFLLHSGFSNAKLLLVQVLAHHTECNPTTESMKNMFPLMPTINSSAIPEGSSMLTQKGRVNAEKLGVSLRAAYGNLYKNAKIYMRPEGTDSAVQTASLIAHGLVPEYVPSEDVTNVKLKSNQWFDTMYLRRDPIYQGWFYCQNFSQFFAHDAFRLHGDMITEPSDSPYGYLLNHTGSNVFGTLQSGILYRQLRAMESAGIPLEPWMKYVYPNGLLYKLVMEEYQDQSTYDIRLNGGAYIGLFVRLVNNYLDYLDNRRLFVLVGDDINIVGLLDLLDVYDQAHIPDYGSYIALELHRIKGELIVRVVHHKGTSSKEPPVPLIITECSDTPDCPLSTFESIFYDRMQLQSFSRLDCRR